MKTRECQLLTALAVGWFAAFTGAVAHAQPVAGPSALGSGAAAAQDRPKPELQASAIPEPAAAIPASPAAGPAGEGLTLNLRGVSVDSVLDYLSQHAGFTIIRQTSTQAAPTVDMVSETPLNQDQIVLLLNKVLTQHNLVAFQEGRILTVMTVQDAEKNRLTPVQVWNSNPASIPPDSQVVTEVIPLHSLNAVQVFKDLSQLLPTDAELTANEGGNDIILTARQSDIRRFTQVIQALDSSGDNDLEVFVLEYADSKAVAQELKDVFTAQDASAGRGNPLQILSTSRGANVAGNGAADSPKRAAIRVNAVSDDQDNAVLVSAPVDIMPGVSNLIHKLDIQQSDLVQIRVFRLLHADPSDIAGQITSLFPDPNTQTGSQNNQGGPGARFVGNQAATTVQAGLSERRKKQTTVIAVPDARTDSVIVTASKDTMAQIASLVADLDSSAQGAINVYAYRPEYSDVEDIQGALADLFGSTTRPTTPTQVNVLAQRANQMQNNPNTGSPATSTPSAGIGAGGTSGGRN